MSDDTRLPPVRTRSISTEAGASREARALRDDVASSSFAPAGSSRPRQPTGTSSSTASRSTASQQRQHHHRGSTSSVGSLNSLASQSSSTRASSSTHIDSSVTKLLVATKQLLESLTRWSRGEVDEGRVSDIYVQLGNDFNAACAAFSRQGINMTDLLSVPDDLRVCLETALSEDASPATLEVYLPKIREIIIGLLQGLKGKQSVYRSLTDEATRRRTASAGSAQRPPIDVNRDVPPPPRQAQEATNGLPPIREDGSRPPAGIESVLPRRASVVPDALASGSQLSQLASPPARQTSWSSTPTRGPDTPPRRQTSISRASAGNSLTQRVLASELPTPERRASRSSYQSPQLPPIVTSSLPLSPTSAPVFDVPASNSEMERPPRAQSRTPETSCFSPVDSVRSNSPPGAALPPLPPPETAAQNASLEALKGNALGRRASKRFSAYTMNRMTGSAQSATLPPLTGPNSLATLVSRSPNAPLVSGAPLPAEQSSPSAGRELASARRKLKQDRPTFSPNRSFTGASATLDDISESPSASPRNSTTSPRGEQVQPESSSPVDATRATQASPAEPEPPDDITQASETVEVSAQPKTIYLQLGRDVKKAQLESAPTLASLRVLFIDRFQYNPGLGDFPSIYLRDPEIGVQYELEDLSDIKDKSVLSLNIEPLDQVRQQIDSGLASLASEIKELKASLAISTARNRASSILPIPNGIEGTPPSSPRVGDRLSQAMAQRVSSQSRSRLAEDASIDATPRPKTMPELSTPLLTVTSGNPASNKKISSAQLRTQLDEIQTVRRDVSVLRQVYADFANDMRTSLGSLRGQTSHFKQLATTQMSGTRKLIDTGKTKLEERTQTLLRKVDDLQDTIEDLRNDVITRKIKPRPQTLKEVRVAIQETKSELGAIGDYVTSVKPMWKKTWETELQNIVDEQQLLNHQEELLQDLKEDHVNLLAVFEQIEKYLSLRKTTGGSRTQRDFQPPAPESGHEGLTTVMSEVRQIAPDPLKRLKAIEQAEKAREKGLSNKQDELASQLGEFVEGKKLKKTGGTEEADRLRQVRDEATLKAMLKT
ncbi:hypothetical protein E5Q_00619 [Mixia osmundae IAM 14324]|uniref:Actin interacting protein 3 C-terminal domain-containing protein n=1 Tax=Mixia osmundae (strain CBS 9802 / IAM 14324 / JCM 22182 / KY 12970) TaxID=764103 RepID=G7DTR2_MIXOS|nr:hypothetical protein E5Q_00619 [Mixia osmundae IAM 14324]